MNRGGQASRRNRPAGRGDNIASRQYQHEVRPLRLALDRWLHELGLQDFGLSIARLISSPNDYGPVYKMLMLEFEHTDFKYKDVLAETVGKSTFGDLIFKGVPLEQAHEQAAAAANKSVNDFKRERSPGYLERERRRALREAVTAGDGALAVTTGLVEACIVCGGPLSCSRGDTAYCSNACRQAAYRKRRMTPSPQRPIARERQETLRAIRKAGLSRRQVNEYITVANLTEAELDELPEHSGRSTTSTLRAMRAAKRRQPDKE